jgi:hemerythrin-like domain-containing protein
LTASEPHFDGREMLMLHDMFRREFGLMPGVVRGVEPGDRDRAQLISAHLTAVSTVLHHHHHGEDIDVWPLLASRCPAQCAPLVAQMEAQHEEIAKIGTEISGSLSAWLGSAAEPSREALADALDRLLPVLREHLGAEEENVVPLMEQYITKAEWDQIVVKEAAGADPAAMPLGFGMLMYEADPEVVAAAIASMPEQIRPVIRDLAARAFAARAEQVYGTATPPRSTDL